MLPPGQTELPALPVLHIGAVPEFEPDTWTLAVSGEVGERRMFGWRAFTSLARTDLVGDVHCVTGWSVLGLAWSGVAFEDLCQLVRPRMEARWVRFGDGGPYDTTLPLEAARETLLAMKLGGRALDVAHGGPLRLVAPRHYAWKSVKWVREIEFLSRDRPGFWERRGYAPDADPARAQRMA